MEAEHNYDRRANATPEQRMTLIPVGRKNSGFYQTADGTIKVIPVPKGQSFQFMAVRKSDDEELAIDDRVKDLERKLILLAKKGRV